MGHMTKQLVLGGRQPIALHGMLTQTLARILTTGSLSLDTPSAWEAEQYCGPHQKQATVAGSSTEAEYIAADHMMKK